MNAFGFRNTYNPFLAKRDKELEENNTTPRKNVSGGNRENRAIGLGASNDRTIYDADELPTMTVKLRRVNKAPKTPGSRQAGRGRTYTRTTIG
jgi:hypothetical protein